jgi:hypothetical protein
MTAPLFVIALIVAAPPDMIQAGDRVVVDLPACLAGEGRPHTVPGFGSPVDAARGGPVVADFPMGAVGTVSAFALVDHDAVVQVRFEDGREFWFDRFRVRAPDGKAALDAAYLQRIDTERRLREFLDASEVTLAAQAEWLDHLRRESEDIWRRVLENAGGSTAKPPAP